MNDVQNAMRTILIILGLVFLAACSPVPECRGLTEDDFDLCVLNLATERGDAALCEHVLLESFGVWCLNSVANATDDPDVCEQIADERGIQYCKRDILIERGDVAGCELVTGAAHDDCYNHFAASLGEWSHCLEIEVLDYKEECLESVSRASRDAYGCLELSEENEGRDACILSLSIGTLNAETCLEVSDVKQRGFCLLNVASGLDDSSICDQIQDLEARGICYQDLL